jgi:hypothetical protein
MYGNLHRPLDRAIRDIYETIYTGKQIFQSRFTIYNEKRRGCWLNSQLYKVRNVEKFSGFVH